jgi:hypothetical protein
MKSRHIPSLAAAFLAGGAAVFLTLKACRWNMGTGDGHGPPPQDACDIRRPPHHDDSGLVQLLLEEDLSDRTFDFPTIAEACSGKQVLPLTDTPVHRRVTSAIHATMKETVLDLNRGESPVRGLRRINEASRFFEDGILSRINAMPGLRCETPPTRAGEHQRSGYPDLRITDVESGRVFYLDPKLVEQGSEASTFRTFYFEPKNETLKITDDAVHLLVGIEHDGKEQQWTFTGWRLVDLSTLRVRLKAEFQSSNAELYRKSVLSLPDSAR